MQGTRKTQAVSVGKVVIGGGAPVSVQSMTKTDTRDVRATVDEIKRLEDAGCEIVRVAVPDKAAARALEAICRQVAIPVVADIHFNYQLALMALDQGIAKLRLNPGNIGKEAFVRQVVEKTKAVGIPIRIGVNAGSLEKDLLERYGRPTPEAMVESALRHVRILEAMDFYDIVISLKATDVPVMVRAYELISEQVVYPLHLGVTEAGTAFTGTVKSAIGIGSLLLRGIGDTIRVSLTGDAVEEVKVGFEILKALGLRQKGPVVISCPSCGRCEVQLFDMVARVEEALKTVDEPVRVAVMGCVVNGPGEARGADVGVAGGPGRSVIFRDGQIIKNVPEAETVPALLEELETVLAERRRKAAD